MKLILKYVIFTILFMFLYSIINIFLTIVVMAIRDIADYDIRHGVSFLSGGICYAFCRRLEGSNDNENKQACDEL